MPYRTVTYTYGDSNWGDKLTSYDGKTITYDGVGNPLNDGTWTYTWRHGRELSTMTNGTITVRNSYNPDGARIAKIVNRSNGSETHRYTYNGGKLVYDIIRINKEGTISNLTILMSYDESGRPFMITYANVSYYYLLNAQGDVVGIMNVSGDIMVEYTYDAWGNVLSITGPMADTMGQHNQLRYRGYVYDPETELYFLNSRFYNPEKGRFINADALTSTGGLLGNNMFAYCANSPVLLCDPNGTASRICLTNNFNELSQPWKEGPGGGGRIRNVRYRSTYEQDSGLILDQETFAFSDMPVGLGTYGKNGCAIIATYNVMQLLGQPQSLGSVCDAYIDKHGSILYGICGVGPWSFDDYFAEYGISCKGYITSGRLHANVAEGDVLIFTVMINKDNIFEGFHTMAAQYVNGLYHVYNAGGKDGRHWRGTSLSDLYSNDLWVSGYIVGG